MNIEKVKTVNLEDFLNKYCRTSFNKSNLAKKNRKLKPHRKKSDFIPIGEVINSLIEDLEKRRESNGKSTS
ncbi:MAG: hypothetical protein AB1410_00100 [Acidobacteriota bacterium]